jgi:membrane-bound lytic murein transglycosylase B
MAFMPLLPSPAFAQNKVISRKTTHVKSYAYLGRKDAMAFADDVSAQRGLDRAWVRSAIGEAHFIPAIQKQMQPASHGFVKNWNVYRSRFIEPLRIQTGAEFWRAYEEPLTRAEREFGVPPEIIVGIIGVETIYGRHMGSYRVIDALATLAFDFPRTAERDRSTFFQEELAQFLTLEYAAHLNVTEAKGSYAGAIGMGQFMPSSWVKYAVDFDGDGIIDLRNSAADAIGSIANFLKAANWQPGIPAYYPVNFDPEKLNTQTLLAPDIRPTFSVQELAANGVLLDEQAAHHAGPLALVELLNGDPEADGTEPTYVAGTENFYAISRYNRSSYYTLAVIELGETIKAERSK